MNWLSFVRHYGPIARNDNMYDETIQRSARRGKIAPIDFEHPMHHLVVQCFDRTTADPVSVVLTGTAGDGKTHLCRQVWRALGGDELAWSSNSPYLIMQVSFPLKGQSGLESDATKRSRSVTIHFLRDLSGWAPQQGAAWEPEKEELLQRFCNSLFDGASDEIFLIAANDGQLVESFRRLRETEQVKRTRDVLEELLVEDRKEQLGVRLKFFNLSRTNSAELLDKALDAFLSHPGWSELIPKSENDVFGANCPIRHNYEILNTPLVRSRLRSLLELCDYNGLHVPIRQILLLLTNAMLGHPDVKDHLMTAADIPKIIADGTVSRASLYNNVFGGNLPDIRRQSLSIFEYLDRFQIGHETSNRIDNMLIFGEGDEYLGPDFEAFVANDRFYGADARFYAAKQEYIEGTSENQETSQSFLQLLIAQRRALFFKIPWQDRGELNLWELTVFKFAGEYLNSVIQPLKRGEPVKRPILWRLVKGLNRVFTGMFISSDRELVLATSGNYSQAKVSRLLVDRISVEPSKGEKVSLRYDGSADRAVLSVHFRNDLWVDFNLTLIRYEFLSRIAMEGALPASFSKECYEDLLAFKSQLVAAQLRRQKGEPQPSEATMGFSLLVLTDQGMPDPRFVEVMP